MPKVPPAAVIAVAEKARTGLSALRQKLVPAPIALLDSIDDFWSFHIVFALAELRVVDGLQQGPRQAEELARALSLDADALYRLLRAATVLGLVKEEAGRAFSLKALGRALCESPHASLRDFIIFMGRYGTRFWRRLPDCVREGKNAIQLETGKEGFEFLLGDAEARECFNRAMTAVSNVNSEAIVAAYDFGGFSRIVDVGGGHGRLLAAVLGAQPGARGVLFDLPEVIEGAPSLLESLGVAARVDLAAGSFFESVPAGGDCYMAKTIIHDWQDEQALSILRNVRRAIRPDGKLLLFECVVTGPNRPHFAKLLDIEMIVHVGGRERTMEEYSALYAKAGFALTRVIPTAAPTSIIEGRPA